ncbi:MAG TPA: hypothetical protein VHZ54_04620 [Solirubrobacterales bacterium]|jgi:hypothetical protein|nr:hypothetical protein [Solirubrobacterales bacterium]
MGWRRLMGFKVREEVIPRTRATHLRLLVYLALADAANDGNYKLFGTMEAWPSQGLLAWELNSSRRAIDRALAELEAAGEIHDTGRRRGRGCVVYELTPPDPKPPYDASAEYPAPTPKSATVADPGAGGFSPTPTLESPTPESVEPPTPIPATEPTPKSATEPEGEPELGEPERERRPSPAAAGRVSASVPRDFVSGLSPSSTGSAGPTLAQAQAERTVEPEETREEKQALFADCERRLAAGQGSTLTRGTRDRLAVELGVEVEA